MQMLAADAGWWSYWAWPIIQFLIGLNVVIFVHEFGHYIACRWAGIAVEEFAIGMPPKLFGFKRGETEYRMNLVLLGGYVKPLGMDDFRPPTEVHPDERSWPRSTPNKRLVMLSSGVAMNLLFAVVAFVLIYLVGIRFIAPVVGATRTGHPAAEVALPQHVADAMGVETARGLKPGDRIVAINGRRIRRFAQVILAGALSDAGETFTFRVEREVGGKTLTFDVTMTPRAMDDGPLGSRYAFGISPPIAPVIGMPGPAGYAGAERFEKDDRIVAIGERPIEHGWDIQPALSAQAGRALDIVVERGGQRVVVPVARPGIWGMSAPDSQEHLTILGLSARVRVASVMKDSPAAAAGLIAGDVIVDYAGQGPPSRAELLAISEAHAGKKTPITVQRDGKDVALTIVPTRKDGRVLIGIASGPEQATAVVAKVDAESLAAKAGMREGAVVTAVGEKPVAGWAQVYAAVRAAGTGPVTMTYTLDGKEQTAEIALAGPEAFNPDAYWFDLPAVGGLTPIRTDPVRGHPLQALLWSAQDTRQWVLTAFDTLKGMIGGRVSVKQISGPLGIGHAAITKAREDFMQFAYFIAMLSTMLAFFNFLPLPVLDGGHVVLTLIEKVRGRPLPMKVLAGIQIAGLVLILGIFLAVTYQDISRWFWGRW